MVSVRVAWGGSWPSSMARRPSSRSAGVMAMDADVAVGQPGAGRFRAERGRDQRVGFGEGEVGGEEAKLAVLPDRGRRGDRRIVGGIVAVGERDEGRGIDEDDVRGRPLRVSVTVIAPPDRERMIRDSAGGDIGAAAAADGDGAGKGIGIAQLAARRRNRRSRARCRRNASASARGERTTARPAAGRGASLPADSGAPAPWSVGGVLPFRQRSAAHPPHLPWRCPRSGAVWSVSDSVLAIAEDQFPIGRHFAAGAQIADEIPMDGRAVGAARFRDSRSRAPCGPCRRFSHRGGCSASSGRCRRWCRRQTRRGGGPRGQYRELRSGSPRSCRRWRRPPPRLRNGAGCRRSPDPG